MQELNVFKVLNHTTTGAGRLWSRKGTSYAMLHDAYPSWLYGAQTSVGHVLDGLPALTQTVYETSIR